MAVVQFLFDKYCYINEIKIINDPGYGMSQARCQFI